MMFPSRPICGVTLRMIPSVSVSGEKVTNAAEVVEGGAAREGPGQGKRGEVGKGGPVDPVLRCVVKGNLKDAGFDHDPRSRPRFESGKILPDLLHTGGGIRDCEGAWRPVQHDLAPFGGKQRLHLLDDTGPEIELLLRVHRVETLAVPSCGRRPTCRPRGGGRGGTRRGGRGGKRSRAHPRRAQLVPG